MVEPQRQFVPYAMRTPGPTEEIAVTCRLERVGVDGRTARSRRTTSSRARSPFAGRLSAEVGRVQLDRAAEAAVAR